MKFKTCLAFLVMIASGLVRADDGGPFQNSILGSLQSITATAVPPNGDGNPYGLAFVPAGFPSGGTISPGDLLVANFNNSAGQQGTGTTIVSISPTGAQSVFATSTLVGLDTALGVFSRGFVIVGNLPVTYPGVVVGQGSLQIFNRSGQVVATLNDAKLLDSPWDLTIDDHGSTALVFVSNAVSGTVTRINLSISSTAVTVTGLTQIASGYMHAPNGPAVLVGPTGLAYDAHRDTLYVAATADNKIFAVGNAGSRTSGGGTGSVIFADQKHLHGPLGLVLAPDGNLITANGDAVFGGGTPNDLVEFMPQGIFVAHYQMDAGNPGAAFGIAIAGGSDGPVRFASVDDNLNTVTIWNLRSQN